MSVTIKTGTSCRTDPIGVFVQDTVEVWISGVRFTTDVDNPEAGRKLVWKLACNLWQRTAITKDEHGQYTATEKLWDAR